MTTADDLHVQASELLGAFALHAVEPDEAEMVASHLGACLRCRVETEQLREVAAAIGNTAEPPPEALWDRIASVLGGSGLGGSGLGGGASAPTARAVTGAPATVRRRSSRPRRRVMAAVGVGAAAACAALAAVFGIGWSDANSRVTQLQTALAAHGTRAAVAAALASPGHRVVRLRTPSGTDMAALVVRRGGGGYVVASEMPALPADETYQLWAEIGNRPISLGLLGAKPAEGDGFSLGPFSGASELMVTVEPSGGVVSPTSAPVASGALA